METRAPLSPADKRALLASFAGQSKGRVFQILHPVWVKSRLARFRLILFKVHIVWASRSTFPRRRFAASTVFFINIATVSSPTPPGTGVK